MPRISIETRRRVINLTKLEYSVQDIQRRFGEERIFVSKMALYEATFLISAILRGSSWFFPNTPQTLDDFISSSVNSSLVRFAQKFFHEQLLFLTFTTSIDEI